MLVSFALLYGHPWLLVGSNNRFLGGNVYSLHTYRGIIFFLLDNASKSEVLNCEENEFLQDVLNEGESLY